MAGGRVCPYIAEADVEGHEQALFLAVGVEELGIRGAGEILVRHGLAVVAELGEGP
jgi:hypothetical protein